jgi:phage recombination protein Bet
MATAENEVQEKAQERTERSLAVQLAARDISNAQWHTLSRNLYPNAHAASVLMVIDYCLARNLDPLKKPCHIVPLSVKGTDGRYHTQDVVLPGIYELRTTAHRTGEYLGHARPEYGELAEIAGVMAPTYCDFTVYRWNEKAGLRAEFPVRTHFGEVVGTHYDKDAKGHVVNDRWKRAPIQMLTKCAEAAALRAAFPDELGGEMAAEEMDHQQGRVIDVTPDRDDVTDLNSELGLLSDIPAEPKE